MVPHTSDPESTLMVEIELDGKKVEIPKAA
jgi:hypothetical protein